MIKKEWLCLILFFSDTHAMEERGCRAFCSIFFCCYSREPRIVAITALTETDTTNNTIKRGDTLTAMMLNSPFGHLNPYHQYNIKATMQLISGIADPDGDLAFSRRYMDGFPHEWAERRYDSYKAIILSIKAQYSKQSLLPDTPNDIITIISLYALKIDAAVNKKLMKSGNYTQSIGVYDDNSFIPPRGYHKNLFHHDNNDSISSDTLFFNLMRRNSDADDDNVSTPRSNLFGNDHTMGHDLYSNSEESSNHQ
jgi:hypothetical protein